MKTRPYAITLLQLDTQPSYEANLKRLIDGINASAGQQLIVAPEVCLTGFDYPHFDHAVDFYTEAITRIKPLVAASILVLTFVKPEEGNIVNQAVVIHNHQVVYRQNKHKLFRLGNEQRYFDAGDDEAIKPFTINGVTYGILICFELRFKELWRQLEGVDIIIIPAMWGKSRKAHLEILSQALAIMNQCFVIVCDSANEDMAKSSAIIHPWGEVVRNDQAEVIQHTIDLKEVKKVRRLINMR
ncbi:MAG TPA: carbon-nitrogen hydrolase family protein [Campylobacterales bacterium]|nr:carbon-nitrogen hydrolase family protein [Campylobacterales bacterium]